MRKGLHSLFASALTVAALATAAQAQAQTYLVNEGFEGTAFPPTGWKMIDADGDGHCWQLATKSMATLNGQQIAMSYTVNPENANPYGKQDNYLVLPPVKVTNANYKLVYKCCAQDEDTAEEYEVLVSETGSDVADFKKKLYAERVENGYDGVELYSRDISLADYVGKTIYIAFRHTGMNTYALGIDDVALTNQEGPKAPSALKVTAAAQGALQATLSWTNPSTNGIKQALTALQAEVYRDGELIATLTDGVQPGTASQYVDLSVPNGSHTYAVVAKTAVGSSLPVQAKVYVGQDVPEAVSKLSVTVVDGQNRLAWQAPAAGANKGYFNAADVTYKIYRLVADQRTLVADHLADTHYTDVATAGTTVSYAVVPCNVAGEGAEATSGQVVHFAAPLKDINVAPDAVVAYTNPRLPFDMQNSSTVTQMLLFPSDLYHATGSIEGLVFKNSFSVAANRNKNIKVWMGETDEEDLSLGWTPASELTAVFDGRVDMNGGENDIHIQFSTPYQYKGKNLKVMVMMDPEKGMGGYFDRFFVQPVTGHPDRTRTYSTSGDDIDVEYLRPSNGDLIEALPAMRVVMAADNAGTIEGRVLNADGQPVAGATVKLEAQNLSATTAADGSYRFYVVKAGDDQLQVSAPRYQTQTLTAHVEANKTLTQDITLAELAKVKVSGQVKLQGVGAAAGVKVSLTLDGDTTTLATDAQGAFALQAYSASDNTLTFSSPLFDSVEKAFNTTADLSGLDITLPRSPIAPFNVQAQTAADGKTMNLTWADPATRTGKTQWTRWSTSETHDNMGGDWSCKDYYVAHAYTAQDLKDSCMVGMSVIHLKAYVNGADGTHYTAMVWRGTPDSHEVVDSVAVPALADAEGWVTVAFPHPVELRADEDYMVGLHLTQATSKSIGQGPNHSKIEGKNNLKWSDNPSDYIYNGYYAWNISALCAVPGSKGEYGQPVVALKQPTYNVYRTEQADGAADVLVKQGVQGHELADAQWDAAHPSAYRYKVVAIYDDGAASEPAVSNLVERKADVDAGVEAILSPVKSRSLQGDVEVKVRLRNYGEKPLTSVPVVVELSDGQTMSATFQGNVSKGQTADFTVGHVTLAPETYYTLRAYTQLEGDAIAADDEAQAYVPNYSDVVLHGFRWDAYDDCGLLSFHANVPEEADFVSEVMPNGNLLQAGQYIGDKFYGFTGNSYYAPQQFVALNPTTWSATYSTSSDRLVFDMTYDAATSTPYALLVYNNIQSVCSVDLATGATEWVANTDHSFSTLACSPDGKMYAIANDFKLYTIDLATGTSTEVGSLGVDDVQPLHSMTFDPKTGRLFWVQHGNDTAGNLYDIDTTTGKARLLGTVRYMGYPTIIVGLNTAPQSESDGISAATATEKARAFVDAAGRLHAYAPISGTQTATVSVCDMGGATVAHTTTAQQHTVLATALRQGVYVVSIVTSDGRHATVKVRR